MHLDEGQLHMVADGVDVPDSVQEHLAACQLCGEAVQEVLADAREINTLLGELSGRVPPMRAATVIEAAGRDRPRVPGWDAHEARGDHGGHDGRVLLRRVAAVLLLLGGAGAAWAVPGSPLPTLAERFLAPFLVPAREAAQQPRPSDRVQEEAAPGGIAVDPGARFAVVLPRGFAGRLSIGLREAGELEVRAGPGAIFVTEPEALRIEGTPGIRVDIEVPGSAPSIAIRVGDETVFQKATEGVEAGNAEVGPDGRYRLDFTGPGG